MKKLCSLLLVCFCTLVFFSCKKDSFITSPDARLSSIDTLKFDTVFTQTGSVTRSFKIANLNDQQLRLSSVKLMGGAGSAYKININGTAATEVNNIEIAANDSIYVFVSVHINPDAANAPFVISDSVLISYNGNEKFVQLQAYGQNAHFLRNVVIGTNTTWTNDRPYVILGSIRVDTLATLTIQAGTKIYSHADAPFVVDGTLRVNGTYADKVIFSGDRLDDPYKNFPGGWPGIYFRGSSKNSHMVFANINNAYQAVVVEQASINANPKLILQQCIIDNAFDAGLLCFNTSVVAENTLISNCGKNLVISLGGDYSFTHCTLAAYSNTYILHQSPVVTIDNSADINGTTQTADLRALFTNCIIWGDNGNIENEIIVNKTGNTVFELTLDHCLYKALNDPANTTFINVLKNMEPGFDKIDTNGKEYDFRITDPAAPGIDQGVLTTLLTDLDNKNRNVGLPDLGAYEKE